MLRPSSGCAGSSGLATYRVISARRTLSESVAGASHRAHPAGHPVRLQVGASLCVTRRRDAGGKGEAASCPPCICPPHASGAYRPRPAGPTRRPERVWHTAPLPCPPYASGVHQPCPRARQGRPSGGVETGPTMIEHQMCRLLSSRIMPRTTIDLDATVLDQLRRRARDEHKSMGQIASERLALALAQDAANATPFDWPTRPMGAPRVDLQDKDALARALDDGGPLRGGRGRR